MLTEKERDSRVSMVLERESLRSRHIVSVQTSYLGSNPGFLNECI
jgi:hypothetical protein